MTFLKVTLFKRLKSSELFSLTLSTSYKPLSWSVVKHVRQERLLPYIGGGSGLTNNNRCVIKIAKSTSK